MAAKQGSNQGGRAWVKALDAFAQDVRRQREELHRRLAEGDDSPFPWQRYTFPPELGPLPPELGTYAKAVLADAMVLEEELAAAARGVQKELTELMRVKRAHGVGGAPGPSANPSLLDQRA